CRNAHFVQFISREEIMSGTNPPQWREGTTLHGYALTTNPADPVWDLDLGSSEAADAYWDNVPGNPVVRGPFSLINADVPSMGPSAAAYDKLGMESDIRRAVFRTYLYCNCELKRLVKWTRERNSQYDIRYTRMSLEKTTAAD